MSAHPHRRAMTAAQAAAHERFLAMLPLIRRQAHFAFRKFGREMRQELVQETIARAYCAYARLVEQEKDDAIYATPLARFAGRQVRAGRRVGTPLNVRDVTSRHCQRVTGVTISGLDYLDHEDDEWKELVVEDKRATPAQIAAMRIDFAGWLRTLSKNRVRSSSLDSGGQMTINVSCAQCHSGLRHKQRFAREDPLASQGQSQLVNRTRDRRWRTRPVVRVRHRTRSVGGQERSAPCGNPKEHVRSRLAREGFGRKASLADIYGRQPTRWILGRVAWSSQKTTSGLCSRWVAVDRYGPSRQRNVQRGDGSACAGH